MEVAGLLAEAHAPSDALRLYRDVAQRRPVVVQALEGTGQMAFLLRGITGRRARYLERALNAASAAHPLADRASAEKNLQIANAVMAIYPSAGLPQRERLLRVVRAFEVARKRYTAARTGMPARTIHHRTEMYRYRTARRWRRWAIAGEAATAATDTWPRWPRTRNWNRLRCNWSTTRKQVTEHVCGEPTGEDAALLRIAASPDTVEPVTQGTNDPSKR